MTVDTAPMTDTQLGQAIAQLRARLDAMPVSEARQEVNRDYIALCCEQMERKKHRKVAA